MKFTKILIIGLVVLSTQTVLNAKADAGYCNTKTLQTQYKKIYCNMKVDNNAKADIKILKIVSDQYKIKTEMVEAVLDDTICEVVIKLNKDKAKKEELEKLPEKLTVACLESRVGISEKLLATTLLRDIKRSYEKEKAMYLKSKALEFKFEASEKYWDGRVGGPLDAPFDLITDLNLIDIVLFGSLATWNNDVYTFPDQENEGKGEEDTPINDLNENGEGEPPASDGLSGEGLGLESDQSGKLPEGCVPLDDPSADPDGSGGINELCGDGKLDVLLGEQCDDGNDDAGDGCSKSCEIELPGSSDICTDPDAIIFKEPNNDGGGGPNGSQPQCPEGSTASALPKISGSGAELENVATQSDTYPGPTIGGTLKQFPESRRPVCPAGETELKKGGNVGGIESGGNETLGINVAGYQFDTPICIPTELCANLDLARDVLFGEGWQENETYKNYAPAIEAMFCVKVIKNNRPLTPYNLNEGCIDCNITAMADALEEALSTNVSPLESTMTAFGISSKFGPNASFNLTVGTKGALRRTSSRIVRAENKATKALQKEVSKPESAVNLDQTGVEKLNARQAQEESEIKKYKEKIALYSDSSGAASDIEINARVTPLIEQMNQIFGRIQSKYNGMASSSTLNETPICQP